MEINKFKYLRKDGVYGSVCHDTTDTITIFSNNCKSLQIMSGQLTDDKWDYGIRIVTPDSKRLKYPGEGGSWFTSRTNALLYALGAASLAFKDDPEALCHIRDKIYDLRNPGLF